MSIVNEVIEKIDALVQKNLLSYELVAEALALNAKIESKSGNASVVIVDQYRVVIGDESFSCSCSTFERKKICKHILSAAFKLGKKYSLAVLNTIEKTLQHKANLQKVLLTGISAFDKITGGLPSNGVVGIFGPSKIGKTFLVSQISYSISHSTKRPALYIDTEGFFTGETKRVFDQLFSRYSEAKVKVIESRNLESLMKLLGLELVLDYKDKKMEAQLLFTTQSFESPLFKLSSTLNASLVVIDSFTMPIKRVFGSATQNLPARSAIINASFARLEEISSELEIPVIVTHHAGKSPVNPMDYYKPYGGSSLLYNLKYLLLLLPHKDDETKRRILRFAWPGMPRDEEVVEIVRDYGYK